MSNESSTRIMATKRKEGYPAEPAASEGVSELYRAGMRHAAEICRNEFQNSWRAAQHHDSNWMSGYEDACDHLSIAIEQAAIIPCAPVPAEPQPAPQSTAEDAPERIWMSRDRSQTVPTNLLPFAFKTKEYDDDIEYARADLASHSVSDPRIEAIREALKRTEHNLFNDYDRDHKCVRNEDWEALKDAINNQHRQKKVREICAQCESNARMNEAGGYKELAERCRQYCRDGHERNELGRAIAEAAHKAGIYSMGVPLTGPHLIMLCDDMGSELAALRSEREWQPIDSAPKGTISVLLGAKNCEIVATGYADFKDNLCTEGHDPTHWQPLPDPPKE